MLSSRPTVRFSVDSATPELRDGLLQRLSAEGEAKVKAVDGRTAASSSLVSQCTRLPSRCQCLSLSMESCGASRSHPCCKEVGRALPPHLILLILSVSVSENRTSFQPALRERPEDHQGPRLPTKLLLQEMENLESRCGGCTDPSGQRPCLTRPVSQSCFGVATAPAPILPQGAGPSLEGVLGLVEFCEMRAQCAPVDSLWVNSRLPALIPGRCHLLGAWGPTWAVSAFCACLA